MGIRLTRLLFPAFAAGLAICAEARGAGLQGKDAARPSDAKGFCMPLSDDGWLDLGALLVASDGSRRLGNHRARFNDSRDRG